MHILIPHAHILKFDFLLGKKKSPGINNRERVLSSCLCATIKDNDVRVNG